MKEAVPFKSSHKFHYIYDHDNSVVVNVWTTASPQLCDTGGGLEIISRKMVGRCGAQVDDKRGLDLPDHETVPPVIVLPPWTI